MDGDTMQKSFDNILKEGGQGSNKDFEITNEEATNFKSAMADPEFQSMLRDYMEEMQDPAQRAEQETYIAELENQNRVPAGKDVVHPLAGFVIKAKFSRNSQDSREKMGRWEVPTWSDAVSRRGLFVNVVTSDKLAKPYSKPSGKRPGGQAWSLPVAVGPLRMEKDKEPHVIVVTGSEGLEGSAIVRNRGDSTTTFDVCYHPEALVRARKLDAFRDIVALSSLEKVEEAFVRATEHTMKVDKNYRILKGVTYKSGTCATMLIAKADITSNGKENDGDDMPTPPAAESKSMTGNPTRERKSKADKSASATTAEDPPCAAPSTKDTTPRAEPKAGDAPTAEGRHNGDIKSLSPTPGATPPKLPAGQRRGSGGAIYKLVESGSFEIADHTTDRVRDTRLPQKLVVTVTLPPDAEPRDKLDTVVGNRSLVLRVIGDPVDSPPRYLDLTLPYEVEDDSKCSASMDKQGNLRITLPVKPPSPPSPPMPPTVVPTPEEPTAASVSDTTGDTKEIPGEEGQEAEKAGEPGGSLPSDTTQPDHSRWVKEAESNEKLEKPWEAKTEEEDAQQALSGEGPRAIDALPPAPPDAEKVNSPGVSQEEVRELFDKEVKKGAYHIASNKFYGPIEGYEFKTDRLGCGYYRDDKDTIVPPIEWNETVKTMCAVVGVPNVVDSSVSFFLHDEGKMTLYFDAEVHSGGGEREGEDVPSIQRYKTEMKLSGGVDLEKSSHDAAEENLVLILFKSPRCEWESKPTPIPAAKTSAHVKEGSPEGTGVSKEGTDAPPTPREKTGSDGLAPGHGSIGNREKVSAVDYESLAYELD